MTRRRAPALAGLVLCCLVVTAAPAAQPWSVEPVATSAAAPFDLKAPDGRLRLLFPGAPDGRAHYAVSEDGGSSWTAEVISEDAPQAAAFGVTFDDLNRTITHAALGGDALVYSTDGDGTAFASTTLDPSAGAGAGGVAVAARAATVGILYHREGALWLLLSTDAGSSWGVPARVADAAPGFLALAIAPSGTFHALHAAPDGRGPLHASSVDGGAGWTVSGVDDASPLSGSGSLLALDGETLVAAYGAGGEVRIARSDDGGASWAVTPIDAGVAPSLALDRWGTFQVAYLDSDGPGPRAVHHAHSVDTRSWTRETVVTVDEPGANPLVTTTGQADYIALGGPGAELLLAWNGGRPAPPAFVDIVGDSTLSDMRLNGQIEEQWYDPVADEWYFRYQLGYRNAGSASATGVIIAADLPAGAETVEGFSLPSLSTERNPTRISYRAGTVLRRIEGLAWLVAKLPGPVAPGTELVLEAEATNDSTDDDPDDNQLTIRHAVPLLTPLVGAPALGGETCRNPVAIEGLAQPDAAVTVLLDGAVVAEALPDANGGWSAGPVPLPAGDHVLSVFASAAGIESPVHELLVTYDPSLAADPLGIVLDDAQGRRQRLQDRTGRSTVDRGWAGLRLFPGREYRLGISSCCPTAPALQEWSLALEGVGTGTVLAYNPASGRFEADLAVPALLEPGVRLPLSVSYRCAPGDPLSTLVATGAGDGPLVDRARVYDSSFGEGIGSPLAGITATLWQAVPAADLGGVATLAWVPWPAELFGSAPNPSVTSDDGHAPFFPPPGRFRWTGRDEAALFQSYGGPSAVAIGGAVAPLVPLSEDATLTRRIFLTGDPVEGRVNISQDEVVEWLNGDSRPHRVRSLLDPALGSGGWDSGEIPPGGRYRREFTELAQYEWTDTVVGGEALLVVRVLFVLPEGGTQGSELTITDEGFGNRKGSVLVGSTTCKVQDWSDAQVRCLIKSEVPPPGLYDVVVTLRNGERKVYPEAFEARSPTIRSVSPNSGEKGTRATIFGSYWGTKKGTVLLGGEKAKVQRWVMGPVSGDSAIDFKVPKLQPGSYDVVVEAPTGTVTLFGGFTVE